MAIENLYNDDGSINTEILETAINSAVETRVTEIINTEIGQIRENLNGYERKTNNEITVLKDTIKNMGFEDKPQQPHSINDFINNLKGGK